ncbi:MULTISPECIES: Dabb family protein [Phyllobacterium]|uniref:Dabb family protein n=1 Tax=Phyllobacterium TaxID=28100 RepID=UPI001FDF480A|nr:MULTISPECIES: Dabb family protein [Phyllobacterium]UXN65846.1 Dabb family protein [Phyllobacterium sp. A18/5-2]
MLFLGRVEIALAISGNLVRMRTGSYPLCNKEEAPPVIRHCVFLRFRDDVPASERQSIYLALEALCAKLPGANAIQWGENVSPETGMDKGFSEGFILDFADGAARDAYLVDAEHQTIARNIVSSTVGGAEGVIVFDMEV